MRERGKPFLLCVWRGVHSRIFLTSLFLCLQRKTRFGLSFCEVLMKKSLMKFPFLSTMSNTISCLSLVCKSCFLSALDDLVVGRWLRQLAQLSSSDWPNDQILACYTPLQADIDLLTLFACSLTRLCVCLFCCLSTRSLLFLSCRLLLLVNICWPVL